MYKRTNERGLALSYDLSHSVWAPTNRPIPKPNKIERVRARECPHNTNETKQKKVEMQLNANQREIDGQKQHTTQRDKNTTNKIVEINDFKFDAQFIMIVWQDKKIGFNEIKLLIIMKIDFFSSSFFFFSVRLLPLLQLGFFFFALGLVRWMCHLRWTDRWMDGWTGGRTDGWMDGKIDVVGTHVRTPYALHYKTYKLA